MHCDLITDLNRAEQRMTSQAMTDSKLTKLVEIVSWRDRGHIRKSSLTPMIYLLTDFNYDVKGKIEMNSLL